MCGICGLLYFDNDRTVDLSLLHKMKDIMVTRGPDGDGYYIDGSCGLGHRRLSIIDITTGQQPLTVNGDGRDLTIVFNGEIYNYLELREELKNQGHVFKTNSDTEVLLIAYKEWGGGCVDHLRGMFAFAIWDNISRSLFVARDRMGIKPLYYYKDTNVFLFASEIKSILESGVVKRDFQLLSLDSFLTLGYVPAPMTMFRNILKLLPGHSMLIDKSGSLKINKYWNLNFQENHSISFKGALEQLDLLLHESIKLHLMSDVPLGVFLSGGLDSSALVALMSDATNQPIKTFSVGYEGAEEANELEYARKVAKKFKTDHHEFILQPYDFMNSIPALVRNTEEPLVETAAIPLYHISKKAKEYATVLLSGEGSDEIFAGYGLYQKMMQIEKCHKWFKSIGILPNCLVKKDKNKKYIDWVSCPITERYRGISSDLTNRIKGSFYSDNFFRYTKSHSYLDDLFENYFKEVQDAPILSKMLYVDSKTWLLDDLLLKADKMTMATSVELRVPFLDHRVVEFAASLPSQYKLKKQEGKYVLKKLMEKYLPDEIIYRKKMGFAVPTKRWFGSSLLDEAQQILLDKSFLDLGFFQKRYINDMLQNHKNGVEDYSRRIFSLLVLNQWCEIFIRA